MAILTKVSFLAVMFLGLAGLIRKNEMVFLPRVKPMSQLEMRTEAEKQALVAGVNPSLIRSLIHHESRWNADAISPVGAIGLMQVMPFNAKECGLSVRELWEPKKNIACGVKLYAQYLKDAGGNPHTAVQIYNGGQRCVNKCKESIQLARNVLATMAVDTK